MRLHDGLLDSCKEHCTRTRPVLWVLGPTSLLYIRLTLACLQAYATIDRLRHQLVATEVAMPTIDELKAKVQAEIDRRGEDLVRVAQTILQHLEPGLREHHAARLVGCCAYCV